MDDTKTTLAGTTLVQDPSTPETLPVTQEDAKRARAGVNRKRAQGAKAEGARQLKADVVEQCRRKVGQPTIFTDDKWERILEAVATYQDLFRICAEPDMPAIATVYRWMRERPQLRDDMRSAWEMFTYVGHSVNQNILSGGVLSTGDFRRDEARATDNRWFMGKVNRRDFGDKTQVDVVSHQVFVLPGDVVDGEGF